MKLSTFLCFLILSSFSASGLLFSQCVPDTTITQPGFYPGDTLLPCADRGVFYDTTIQFRNFDMVDAGLFLSQAAGLIVQIDSITITGIDNIPDGIQFSCNPPTCVFAGGTNGCLEIFGTTNDKAGDYPLDILADIRVTLPNGDGINFSGSAGTLGFSFTFHVKEVGQPCPCPVPSAVLDFSITDTLVSLDASSSSELMTTSWDLGDGTIITDQTTFSHVYPNDSFGIYPLTLIVSNDCNSDTLTQNIIVTPKNPTGIFDLAELEFTMYPNPTSGDVFLNFPSNNDKAYSIELIDLAGKVLVNRSTQKGETTMILNVEELPIGSYFLRVNTANATSTKKLIIN